MTAASATDRRASGGADEKGAEVSASFFTAGYLGARDAPQLIELENVMRKLVAVVALALSAANLSAVAMTNTDRHGEAASPAASECIKPWPFDVAPFGRCPDK
jgi:hypothetical protein